MEFRYKKILILVEVVMVVAVLVMINKIWQLREKPIVAEQPQKNTCDHCNILLLDIDILRADDLPCYGYYRNTAPNICSFGKKSTVFTDNYSTSFWTLPDIFSTVTSLYPAFHGVATEYVDSLNSNVPTLAETLKNEGYQTAFVFIGGSNNPAILNQENGGLRGYDIITEEPAEKVISDLSKSPKPWFIHYYRSELHLPYVLPDGASPMDTNLVAPKNLPTTETDFNRLLNIYLKKHYSEIFKQKAIDEYSSIILAPDKINSTAVTDLFEYLGGRAMIIKNI